MRAQQAMKIDAHPFPLLESADLPGEEDWSVLEALHHSFELDADEDHLESITVAPSFDD